MRQRLARAERAAATALCTGHAQLLLVLCRHRDRLELCGTLAALNVASTVACELELELQVEPLMQTPSHSVATSARQRSTRHSREEAAAGQRGP